ncbi:GNAT family N-acetyltransferase, partial [Candidatus Woesearchaeota archaeon]|nr:GNAT family N-acetyltransferase [Candidatus Woesearchaeota archaeon]
MTGKIQIKHLKEEDFDGLWEYASDPDATRYLTWKAYNSKEEFMNYFNNALKKKSFPDEVLGIYLDDKIIGSVHIIQRKRNNIQFGFGIIKRLWNKGICTKVVSYSLQYTLDKWPIKNPEIWADINVNNKAAKKVIEKNGFVLEKKEVEKNRDRYSQSS